jgi:hypothetical protein
MRHRESDRRKEAERIRKIKYLMTSGYVTFK